MSPGERAKPNSNRIPDGTRQKRRYAVSTDIRSRAIQAFWAIHVEAMNWNGMGVREYAASFQLSPTSPREWRDRFENTEVEDGAGGKDRVGCDGGEVSEEDSAVCELCLAVKMKSPPLSLTIRGRIFKDKEKLAVVLESEQPGMSIAEVCRRHDIVMSMVFRWRVQFGFAGKKAAKLVTVVLPEGSTGGSPTPATRRDRLRPPDEMMPLQLPDGRRVFAPEGRGPDAIQTAHSGSVTVL